MQFSSWLSKNIVLPIADRAMHTKVFFYYKLIQKMQDYSSKEIESWQNKKLQELIHHAYQNTQYYRELFDELKIFTLGAGE